MTIEERIEEGSDTIMIPSKSFPWKKIPFYSLSMTIIYVVMYVMYCKTHQYDTNPKITDLLFTSDDSRPSKIYRLYTYSLLHINDSHLVNNCLAQLFFGGLMEYHSASWRIAMVHTSSIVYGALMVNINNRLNHITNSYLLGVSGGVYGLLSSLITIVILNFHDLPVDLRRYYLMVVALWLVSDIVCYELYYDPNLSYADHIGGAICGFLTSFSCYKNVTIQRGEYIIIGFASLINILLFLYGFIMMFG